MESSDGFILWLTPAEDFEGEEVTASTLGNGNLREYSREELTERMHETAEAEGEDAIAFPGYVIGFMLRDYIPAIDSPDCTGEGCASDCGKLN